MYCGEKLVGNKSSNFQFKKELNVNVLYMVLASLIIAGGVILYFAGVFDEPKITVNNEMRKPVSEERVGNQNSVALNSPQIIDLKTLTELKKIEKSIKANPNDTQAMVTLGNKYFDFGHFKEAMKFYKMYLNKLPNSPDVLVDLGVCYYNLKDYPNAEKYFEKAVKLNPKHQIAFLNLGIVNEAMGNTEKAKNYWKKVIAIDKFSQFAQRAQSFLNNY